MGGNDFETVLKNVRFHLRANGMLEVDDAHSEVVYHITAPSPSFRLMDKLHL